LPHFLHLNCRLFIFKNTGFSPHDKSFTTYRWFWCNLLLFVPQWWQWLSLWIDSTCNIIPIPGTWLIWVTLIPCIFRSSVRTLVPFFVVMTIIHSPKLLWLFIVNNQTSLNVKPDKDLICILTYLFNWFYWFNYWFSIVSNEEPIITTSTITFSQDRISVRIGSFSMIIPPFFLKTRRRINWYVYYFLMLYIFGFVENHKSHVESLFRDLNSKNYDLK